MKGDDPFHPVNAPRYRWVSVKRNQLEWYLELKIKDGSITRLGFLEYGHDKQWHAFKLGENAPDHVGQHRDKYQARKWLEIFWAD